MINAMKKADSTDPKKYIEERQSNTFDGVTDSIAFAQSGDLKTASATLYQEQGGKWVVLGVEQTHPK
jgi:branched-chain amino acid transport system substrate-binding protein